MVRFFHFTVARDVCAIKYVAALLQAAPRKAIIMGRHWYIEIMINYDKALFS